MKKLLLSAVLLVSLVSCRDTGKVYVQEPLQSQSPTQDVVVTPSSQNIGDNLDLQSLGELVKQCGNAQDIENKLNSDGSINNLDLDGDGQVDYIKVNEVNDAKGRGFIFLVDGPNGGQQVAQITLSQSGDVANLVIQGNPTYYGDAGYYTTSHLVRDMLIMNYLYGYHRPYYSPYRYGHYPRYYHSYRSRPYASYRSSYGHSGYGRGGYTTRTTTRTVSRPVTRTSSYGGSSYGNSSYKSRAVTPASTRARSLASPTTSQKSFRTTSPANSRPVTSGFGSRRSSSSSYGGSSSSSRSSSSFGSSSRSSSRSSFGSSSRSSSRRR